MMPEQLPFVRGQLIGKDGKPHLGPLLAETPTEVVEFLLGTQGDWWIEADGKDVPLLTLDLVWMTQEAFEKLGPWEG